MNLNKAFVLGNLTRDPERRNLPSGQPVVNFGVATNRFFTSRDGEKQQEAEFHNVVVFGKLAETASQYLNKGSLVLIEGRLRTRNWQDTAGVKHYRTEIIAERLQLGPRGAARTTTEFQPKPYPKPQIKNTVADEEIPVIEEDSPNQEQTPEEEQKENPESSAKNNRGNNPKNNLIEEKEEIKVEDIPF